MKEEEKEDDDGKKNERKLRLYTSLFVGEYPFVFNV